MPSSSASHLSESLKEIQTLAEGEMARRLQSFKLRAKIPDAALLRFIIESQKLLVKQREERHANAAPKATNIVHLLAQRALPEDRQIELLVRFIKEVGPERAEEMGLSGALEILVGEQRAGQLLAIDMEETDGQDPGSVRALEQRPAED